jgi:PQQ-dependent dehydrogenase (methanol/ethanol family)
MVCQAIEKLTMRGHGMLNHGRIARLQSDLWQRLSRIPRIKGVAFILIIFGVMIAESCPYASEQSDQDTKQDLNSAQSLFNKFCSGCHGINGGGGDRAPALVNNTALRALTESDIQRIIKNGNPAGMPAFSLPSQELGQLARWLRSQNTTAIDVRPTGDIVAGERFFFGTGGCAGCHMVGGRGNFNGPDLSAIAIAATVHEIELVLDDPTSQMGVRSTPTCPPWAFCPDVRWGVAIVRLRNGSVLRGFARNETEHDVQLQTFDGRIYSFADADLVQVTHESKSYMPPLKATSEERRDLVAYLSTLGGVQIGPGRSSMQSVPPADIRAVARPKRGEWPMYNGLPSGNRHSLLDQIDTKSVAQLQLQWIYPPGGTPLETTPVVSGGIMYVTGVAQVCALDARTGDSIWCSPFTSSNRSRAERVGDGKSAGVAEDNAISAANSGGANALPTQWNRGVALLGDRIFITTNDAHLICLNRITGGVMWNISLVESGMPGLYIATSAPMVVGDLVVSGVAGGDMPMRGFLAAFKATTGELAWRVWTIPKAGEPASETWKGRALPTGGGATWATGSYDAEAGILYWAVGNPYPDTDGDERGGANLYTDSVIALDAKTGAMRWYYQFTPHDLHDWDATEPLVLVDTQYRGRSRKLLLQANRNGFFYALDRISGELLFATPFVRKLTWASGVGLDGVPKLLPGNDPTLEGTKTCPSVRGATNWYSSAFSPETKLFYVMAAEDCSIYKKQGSVFNGYRDTSDPGKRYLRAVDIETGAIAWEIPLAGTQEANYGGVLSTAGGLVFYGETGGAFAAADARTGKTLWRFRASASWRASPMTYMIAGRQYVGIAAGGNILCFALGAGVH